MLKDREKLRTKSDLLLELDMEQRLGSIVVVEPGKPAYTKKIAFSLERLQREADGYIEAFYPFEKQGSIICNEEGKLDGRALNRARKELVRETE